MAVRSLGDIDGHFDTLLLEQRQRSELRLEWIGAMDNSNIVRK